MERMSDSMIDPAAGADTVTVITVFILNLIINCD
jgi:hypothetical protein